MLNAIQFTMIVYSFCPLGKADIIVVPRDTESKVGEQTFFNCSSNVTRRQINWNHGSKYVYAGGSLLEPYSDRFKIDDSSTAGVYNLVISSIELKDAGEYSCVDDGGLGTSVTAQLVVLDNDPVCESNVDPSEIIGPNSCDIEPDELRLSCKSQYSGNLPPKMVWRKSGEETPITDGIDSVNSQSGNEVIYYLTMNASISMDGQSYICETARSTAKEYRCNSGVVRILYAFSNETVVNRTTDDEIICSANSDVPCNYIWVFIQDDNQKVVSTVHTLKPEKPGRYRCEAKCLMKNSLCSFIAMVLEVSSSPQEVGQLWLVVLVIVPIVILIIAVIIFCILRRQQQRRNKQKHSNDTEKEDETRIKILKHTDFLVERIDSDFGLLDFLLGSTALSRSQLRKIKSSPNEEDRNQHLLNYILSNNSTELLLSALTENGQSHLYNYLEGDGDYRSDFKGEWPLTEKEILILDRNHSHLVDLLDTKDLLCRLYSTGVINRRQRDFIATKPARYEKNETLLDILRKRSLNDYRLTILALVESKQKYSADILDNGGEVADRVDAILDELGHFEVSDPEDEIVAVITNQLGGYPLSESSEVESNRI